MPGRNFEAVRAACCANPPPPVGGSGCACLQPRDRGRGGSLCSRPPPPINTQLSGELLTEHVAPRELRAWSPVYCHTRQLNHLSQLLWIFYLCWICTIFESGTWTACRGLDLYIAVDWGYTYARWFIRTWWQHFYRANFGLGCVWWCVCAPPLSTSVFSGRSR